MGMGSCVAVAHELGLTYVHQPILMSGHANLPNASATRGLDAVGRDYASLSPWMAKESLPPLLHPFRHGWFDRVAAGRRATPPACRGDGRTVYTTDHCWEWFWPRTVEAARAAAWFTVQPALAAALAPAVGGAPVASSAAAAQRRHAHARRRPRGERARPVVVAVHIRRGDCSWQQLPAAYYLEVMRALRVRHAASAAASRALRFEVHHNDMTDGTDAAFAHLADTNVAPRTTPALAALDAMASADLVVASMSGLSIAAAMLGNTTLILPCCDPARRPLPHWHLAPCRGGVDLSAICWPPGPQLAATAEAPRGGSCDARGHGDGLRVDGGCQRCCQLRTETTEMWYAAYALRVPPARPASTPP